MGIRQNQINALQEGQKGLERVNEGLRSDLDDLDDCVDLLDERLHKLEQSCPYVRFPSTKSPSPEEWGTKSKSGYVAYGEQYGEPYDRLNNRITWVTAGGSEKLIADMTVDHVENCMRLLREGRFGYHGNIEYRPVMLAFKARLANEALRLNAVAAGRNLS